MTPQPGEHGIPLTRKPIQITIGYNRYDDGDPVAGDRVYALCDDGTMWYSETNMDGEWKWWLVPLVPQDEREDIFPNL